LEEDRAMNEYDDETKDGPRLAPETLAAQALGRIDPVTRALVPAIHPSTTYERDKDGGYSSGRGYTRPNNPTYDEAEELLTALEGGQACLLFASGMAAGTAVFQALLPGDHVIASRVMYWALRTWLVDFAVSWGLDVEFVDTADIDALAAAVRPGRTKLVWLETPANPLWDVSDIAAAARVARDAGARLAVDSTAATPVLTRPLELGADLVMHSASKYLNGHSDVLAGAIVTARVDGFWQRIRAWRRDGGAVVGPFEAWLLLRGMRTLFVRVHRSCVSALAIARHLQAQPAARQVLYPGLPEHPGHDIAAKQMHGGFGGMLSIRLAGGEAAAMQVAANVKVFKRATSLGGVESLIEHRASIEGPSTPVPDDLLRLSIGLENVNDLIADLDQALNAVAALAPAPIAERSDGRGGVGDRDLAGRIERLLAEKIRPMLADRGGDLRIAGLDGGVLTLEPVGSPGAAIPVRAQITAMIRHYLPEVADVHIAIGGSRISTAATLQQQVQDVLDTRINPAVKAHGGAIRLETIDGATAHVRFEGACQGCAMAEVTLRQGVEVLLREHVPALIGVTDVTDPAGRNPYFKTRKGAE
jgi:cystathionine gamma-synthase